MSSKAFKNQEKKIHHENNESAIPYEALLQKWIAPAGRSHKSGTFFSGNHLTSSTLDHVFTVPHALVIGNQEEFRSHLGHLLNGMEISFAECSVSSCFELYQKDEFDPVIVLIDLSDEKSPDLLRHVEKHFAMHPVIVFDNVKRLPTENEIIAKLALFHFQSRHDIPAIRNAVRIAGRFHQLMLENGMVKQSLSPPCSQFKVLGQSPPMRQLKEDIENASYLETPVVLLGEMKTKKNFIAQMIHCSGPRARYPFDFIALNLFPAESFAPYLCGCVPGYNPIYPNGFLGKLSLMHRGTFFIAQVNRLQLPDQKILAQFLKTRTFCNEGSDRPIYSSVRIITSYHVDLLKEVELGTFDEELYGLLHATTIHVPSLREVKSDIPEFFQVSASWMALLNRLQVPRFDQSAIDKLVAYSWPHNTVEFEMVVQRAVLSDTDGVIREDDIHFGLDMHPKAVQQPKSWGFAGMCMDEIQKQAIMETLEYCHGNKSQAAKILKITERTLYSKIKKYGISLQ